MFLLTISINVEYVVVSQALKTLKHKFIIIIFIFLIIKNT